MQIKIVTILIWTVYVCKQLIVVMITTGITQWHINSDRLHRRILEIVYIIVLMSWWNDNTDTKFMFPFAQQMMNNLLTQ